MDSLVNAAARALTRGDPLAALKLVALRDDAPALALRGIAMAQLGALSEARTLLRRAGGAFGRREELARARCTAAEAEVALAARELRFPARRLAEARATFEAHGRRENALHAQLLEARRALLVGEFAEAERCLAELSLAGASPLLVTTARLVAFDVALRRTDAVAARAALTDARVAAARSGIFALEAETERAAAELEQPAARVVHRTGERAVTLDEVAALRRSRKLLIDACTRVVSAGEQRVSLATRPVLFALVRALGEAFPGDVARTELLARCFGARVASDSARVRLRVEVARLRKELRGLADVSATAHGFVLTPRARGVVVLAPPLEGADGAVLGLLADGAPWSTSSLSLALGQSQRSVQRALRAHAEAGRVRALGRGRQQRWVASLHRDFSCALLLPSPV